MMSKTILSEIDGFTTLPDLLVKRYGLFTAAVFGRMWRYCQMQDGVCRATLDTIATELNVSKMTIIRHIETLVYDGFLKDTTPDRKNKPHIYADTGKVAMYNKFGMALTVTESESKPTLTESDSALTSSDPQSHTESLEDSNKKQSKKQKIREGATPEPKANQIPEVILFHSATGRYPARSSFKTVIEAIAKIKTRLGRDVTIEDLQPFLTAWTDKAWNPLNLAWLTEWAVPGYIPNGKGNNNHANNPKPVEERQYSPELLARAERINELRRAGHVV
jgi:DNA-binding Lrp family transcriptional regulator